jgi:hypothetical protein
MGRFSFSGPDYYLPQNTRMRKNRSRTKEGLYKAVHTSRVQYNHPNPKMHSIVLSHAQVPDSWQHLIPDWMYETPESVHQQLHIDHRSPLSHLPTRHLSPIFQALYNSVEQENPDIAQDISQRCKQEQ